MAIHTTLNRVVQLDFAPEMEGFCLRDDLLEIERDLSNSNFWSKIQLDHPVLLGEVKVTVMTDETRTHHQSL